MWKILKTGVAKHFPTFKKWAELESGIYWNNKHDEESWQNSVKENEIRFVLKSASLENEVPTTWYSVTKNRPRQIILINLFGRVIALVGPGNATLTFSSQNSMRHPLCRFPIIGLFTVAYVCLFLFMSSSSGEGLYLDHLTKCLGSP